MVIFWFTKFEFPRIVFIQSFKVWFNQESMKMKNTTTIISILVVLPKTYSSPTTRNITFFSLFTKHFYKFTARLGIHIFYMFYINFIDSQDLVFNFFIRPLIISQKPKFPFFQNWIFMILI